MIIVINTIIVILVLSLASVSLIPLSPPCAPEPLVPPERSSEAGKLSLSNKRLLNRLQYRCL